MIGTPGIHDGIPEQAYHGDKGSLSVSGAKVLIGKSPAHFRWMVDNGQPPKRVFDFGHAAHAEVLGVGLQVEILQTTVTKATKTTPAVISEATNRRSTYTQDQEAEARKAGRVPLLREEYDRVQAMAAAIRAHPLASQLFDPEHGKPEQSFFFHDEPTGVLRRGRLDWLPDVQGSRLILPDFKTAESSDPRKFGATAARFGYASQDDWYSEGARILGLADDVAFLFVVQEKEAPYVVSVIELDAEAKAYGARKNREAIDLYAKCVAEDHWPGYAEDVALVSLPKWTRYEEDIAA